jgi:hypothetical protein
MVAVKGKYKNGKVTLGAKPPYPDEREVIVTFLDDESGSVGKAGQLTAMGCLKGKVRFSDKDFAEAKKIWK